MVTKPGDAGFLVTETIVDLLTTIMEHADDHKGLSVNKVLHLWPAHYK